MELEDTSRTTYLDECLKTELSELKTQIEENELVYGILNKNLNSMYIPKDPEYFKQKRRFILKRIFTKTHRRNSKLISDVLRADVNNCDLYEHNSKSLPLLLRECYMKQKENLIERKHQLLMRFQRYCVSNRIKECIYYHYDNTMKDLMIEYDCTRQRLNKLECAMESSLFNNDIALDELTPEDLTRFMRYMIEQFNSIKFMSFMIEMVRWSSVSFHKAKPVEVDEESDDSSKSSHYFRSISEGVLPFNVTESKFSLRANIKEVGTTINKDNEPKSTSHAACGGGYAVDESNLQLPLHTNQMQHWKHLLVHLCHCYKIQMTIKSIKTSADEMELYGQVNRRFKMVYSAQEIQRTFPVYDAPDNKLDKWGCEGSNRALLKPANWQKELKYVPYTDLIVEQYLNQIKCDNIRDEFLEYTSFFVKEANPEEVINKLRHHALMVQHMPVIQTTSVINSPKGLTPGRILRSVYVNNSNDNNNLPKKPKANKPLEVEDKDTYDFNEVMQGLGLEEVVDINSDSSAVQGAFLSYLHLRILKIRDLQRTSLSILNYFRSLERTIAINRCGYPHQSKEDMIDKGKFLEKNSYPDNKHLFHSPESFQISPHEFMTFDEVENHLDFYFHEDYRVHVRDQKGCWIIYDLALEDLKTAEEELILIGSYFINKDRDLRKSTLFKRKKTHSENESGELNVAEYGHAEIDRFGVLYDLWSNYTGFLEAKKSLIDVLMECYNTILGKIEKKKLGYKILDIIYKKARLDLNHHNFIESYRAETMIFLKYRNILHRTLHEDFLYHRINLDYCYPRKFPHDHHFKLTIAPNTDEPVLDVNYILEFIPSRALSLNLLLAIESNMGGLTIFKNKQMATNSALRKEFRFLEFLETEIQMAYTLFRSGNFDETVQDNFLRNKCYLDNLIGANELAEKWFKSIDSRNTRGDKRSKKIKMIDEFGRLLDLLMLRYRLGQQLLLCDYLREIYLSQAELLGYHSYHLFINLECFETFVAITNEYNQRKPLLYVSSIQDDDSQCDRIFPRKMVLAINELDNVHMGKFDFDSIPKIIQTLESKNLENLQLTLKIQIGHKYALESGISLCHVSKPSVYLIDKKMKDPDQAHRKTSGDLNIGVSTDANPIILSEANSKSNPTPDFNSIPPPPPLNSNLKIFSTFEKVDSARSIPISAQIGPTPLALDSKRASQYYMSDSFPEAFLSIQIEKALVRERILNAFVKKYPNIANIQDNEIAKIKREYIHQYSDGFLDRISQYALRSQIIFHYNSILSLLRLVPEIAQDFFLFGEWMNTPHSLPGTTNVSINTKYRLHKRPKHVLSNNGESVVNIWYIPHFTEVLFFLREAEDSILLKILSRFARLVIAFHDNLHCIIAHYRLGFEFSTQISQQLKTKVALQNNLPFSLNTTQNIVHELHRENDNPLPFCSDYGDSPLFELKSQLMELEAQIQLLENPCDIDQVANLLEYRRTYNLTKTQLVTLCNLPEMFLACNDQVSYNAVTRCTRSAVSKLLNCQGIDILSIPSLEVPENLFDNSKPDQKISSIFPWRFMKFQSTPFMYNHESYASLCDNIVLCYSGISLQKKSLVRTALYNFNLILEDMNQSYFLNGPKPNQVKHIEPEILLLSKKYQKLDMKVEVEDGDNADNATNKSSAHNYNVEQPYLFVREHAVDNYKVNLYFMAIIYQMYVLKTTISHKIYHVSQFDSPELYKKIVYNLRKQFLYPMLRKISVEIGRPFLYLYGPTSEKDFIIYPKELSFYVGIAKLVQMNFSYLENYEIEQIRKIIRCQIDGVIKQRNFDQFSNKSRANVFKILKDGYLEPPFLLTVRQCLDIDEKFGPMVDHLPNESNQSNIFPKNSTDTGEVPNDNPPNNPVNPIPEPQDVTFPPPSPPQSDNELIVASATESQIIPYPPPLSELSHLSEDTKTEDTSKIAIIITPQPVNITLTKSQINCALQQLSNSLLLYQRESFEQMAMYFENQIKFQRFRMKIERKKTRNYQNTIYLNDQSNSVEKQFILANKISKLITEVNYLRGYINLIQQNKAAHEAKYRENLINETRYIARNLHCVGFELVARIDIAKKRFVSEVLWRINVERINASELMMRIKEKHGTKFSADDELAHRNISLSKDIVRARCEKLYHIQMSLRFKALTNWIFHYTMIVQNKQLSAKKLAISDQCKFVPLVQTDAQQQLKLAVLEVRRLKETLDISLMDLKDMKATIHFEMENKNKHRQQAEIEAIRMRENLLAKNKKIAQLLKQQCALDSRLTTLEIEWNNHKLNKKTVVFSSFKKVEKLKEQLEEERTLKKQAFLRVDQLLSDVYEFEASLAMLQNNEKKLKDKDPDIPKLKRDLAEPKNPIVLPGRQKQLGDYPLPKKLYHATSYREILNRFNSAYSPGHYLSFRRDRMGIERAKQKLINDFTEKPKKSSLILPKINK